MNRRPVLISLCILMVLPLSLDIDTAQARRDLDSVQTQAPLQPTVDVGTSFTYHGLLQNNGVPVNGGCDFQFGLFDAPSNGVQIGSTQTKSNLSVNSGYFDAILDFGGVAFNGDARWLEVSVRCPAGSGAYAKLNPRQELLATPYAQSLRPGATINGLNNRGSLSFGSTTRQMINLWGTQYGIGIQSYTQYFRTDNGGGFAWYEGGIHSDKAGDPGFLGSTQMALNQSGLTVYGKINAGINSASNAAIYGKNDSTAGGWGVYGYSSGGTAVFGESNSGNGVMGISAQPNTSGVIGNNTNGGYGVKGSASNCVFEPRGDPCTGVKGEGEFIGVTGYGGVRGVDASGGKDGINAVGGERGVYGANNTITVTAGMAGVVGWGKNSPGVIAQSDNGNPLVAYGSDTYFVNPLFYVSHVGNVYADGSYSSPAADFAESLPAASGLEAGDVLVIGPDGKLTLSSKSYQVSLAGVYSTKPAFLGGDAAANPTGNIPLAVVGVVPVKVIAENGPIQPGDPLTTSSTPGFAMKASPMSLNGMTFYPSGVILGKALDSLSSGSGIIKVLITLH